VSFLRKQFAPDKPAWNDVTSAVNRIRQSGFEGTR
jgi:hypothetical protein